MIIYIKLKIFINNNIFYIIIIFKIFINNNIYLKYYYLKYFLFFSFFLINDIFQNNICFKIY